MDLEKSKARIDAIIDDILALNLATEPGLRHDKTDRQASQIVDRCLEQAMLSRMEAGSGSG